MSMSTDQRATPNQRWVPEGVRHDLTWDERIQRHRQSLVPRRYPTWQPDQQPESPIIQVRVSAEPVFDPVRPGLLRLYAARMAHAESTRKPVRATREGERLLVGEVMTEGTPLRTLALVSETRLMGRSLPAHYSHLHPAQHLRFRRCRMGRMPAGSIVGATDAWTLGRPGRTVWRKVWSALDSNVHHSRLGASPRLLLAACAALLLMLGAASTGFATQDPHQADPGEAIPLLLSESDAVPARSLFHTSLPPGELMSDCAQVRSGLDRVTAQGKSL